ITEDQIQDLALLDGVRKVTPVGFIFQGMGGFGPGRVIVGIDPDSGEEFVGSNIGMKDGRDLQMDDTDVAIVGSDFSDKEDLEVGDFITVEDVDFEIVGVIEKTDNANVDGSVMINVADTLTLRGTDTYQMVYVIPYEVEDVETIAETIEAEYEDLQASTSKDMARQASQISSQIQLYTFGLGAIAAVVGGLGIMNTMVMAVLERRKEIGILKAMGATKFSIIKQFLTESTLISLIGGVVGVSMGSLLVFLIKLSMPDVPLRVTPELIGIGVGFALLLGFVGGAYPSWTAAKLDPVEAIRYG
ncbi:MAG: FtsX-like permease family protein, partial [Candidatus Aenigmatarchaeota archaeon]